MVKQRKSITLYRVLFVGCFVLLLLVGVALLLWVSFAQMASGMSRTRSLVLRELILGAMIVGLVTYFRWPWVAAMVGWADMGMILAGAIAWEEPGMENFLIQFSFDIVFLVASQVGLVSFLILRRKRKNSERQTG